MEIRSNSFDASKQPPQAADLTRSNRESIDKATPAVNAEDMRAKLARSKAALAERAELANAKLKAQRIDAARAQHAERLDKVSRPAEGKPSAQVRDVIDIRPEVADASQAERASLARESLLADRAHLARDKNALTTDRAQAARSQYSERVDAARDEVSLSDTGLRLRADVAVSDVDGGNAERVAELKALHQQGRLNTDDLVARAAYHMLSGE